MAKKTTVTRFITASQINIVNGTKAYIELRQKVTEHGILKRSYGFYILSGIITCIGLFFSMFMIFVTPISWGLLLWCLLLAFFTVQVGGIVHDAGHRAITNSTKYNDIWGHVFGSLVIMGYSHWK